MDGDPFSPAGERPLLANRYRVGALVGSGAMAEVYRAYDLKLERPVAIKRFISLTSAVDRVRFDEEARLLAGLSHPGLVTIYDAGLHQHSRHLVMRLVEGPNLHLALSKERPTVDEVLALANRLLPTLAYVHARGIVHRDIKPSNILIDLDGDAYLADFGLARLVDADHITRSGEIVGTAAYLAPEQVRGEPATPASDVYSLGLVLLQCLTGRQEYRGSQAEAALARLTRDPVIPAGLPGELAMLLADMTATDAAQRPSAAECADRFAEFAVSDLSTIPMIPRPRRRRAVFAAAGVLLATAFALALVLRPSGPVDTTAPSPSVATTSTAGTTPVSTTTVTSTGTSTGIVVDDRQPDPTVAGPGPGGPGAGGLPPGQAKKPGPGGPGGGGPPPGKGKHG